MDYYRTLGISKNATAEEVKAAFRALALKFHPDRHAASDKTVQDQAGARFKEVSEAYQVLIDDGKRAVYNREGRAGFRYANRQGYEHYKQYARYRGARGGQSAGYGYDQSFRARGFETWWRAPSRGFGRTDYLFHASLALLGLGAFLFIDQAGESMWRRNNAGKSFEELRAAREARSQTPDPNRTPEAASNTPGVPSNSPRSPPPQLLVRRRTPGWPFHQPRRRDVSADSPRDVSSDTKNLEGSLGNKGQSGSGGKPTGRLDGSVDTRGAARKPAQRLGDAAGKTNNRVGVLDAAISREPAARDTN